MRPNRILTTDFVTMARRAYRSGEFTRAELASIYGVSMGTLKKALAGPLRARRPGRPARERRSRGR